MSETKKSRGRPATGKNTVVVGFSVHKDIAEAFRKAAKQLLDGYKAKSGAKIAATDPPASKKGSARESVVKKKGAGKGANMAQKKADIKFVKDYVKPETGLKDLNQPTNGVKDLTKLAPKTNYQVKTEATSKFLKNRQAQAATKVLKNRK